LGSTAKHLRRALLILASLVIAVLGTGIIGKRYPWFIGFHGSFIAVILPLFAVASYYLLDFLLRLLTRLAGFGEAGAEPAKKFSWLPLASLLLSSAGFFLPFVSVAGIMAGNRARRKVKEGQPLRGMGMATVGIITGYLFLLFWAYMAIMFIFLLLAGTVARLFGL
jgi:hypothetical protein